MNLNNLQQVFEHYIDRFDYINDSENQEYYKWQVCQEYPVLMKKALSADDECFSDALKDVKKCTFNLIDSYTQPFGGLVDFARTEPGVVRGLFKDLYADDGGDLKIRMEKIEDFFKHADDQLNRLMPESHLYKQNSHSVSAYLFLNDPDNHYMYKAVQSQRFADCIEFYDDWGSGENIRLDVYHRMCDELVVAINDCRELLETHESRFDGRLKLSGGELHPDKNKHILAFDLIYCCSVYDLFDGITYTKRNMKEKQLYLAEKAKAQSLKEEFERAKTDADLLEEAIECFVNMINPGDKILHRKYGEGIVNSVDFKTIDATYSEGQKSISLPMGIGCGILKAESPDFDEKLNKYMEILRKYDKIRGRLEMAARALEPYDDYLD